MSAQGLPPNLLALFAPRPPLKYLPPCGGHGKKPAYTGVAESINLFETTEPPLKEHFETPDEKKERKKQEVLEEHRKHQAALIARYDPNTQPSATKNPFATLFVGRLSYETTEKKLKKEFEHYGPIRKVKIITDLDGKSRGFAFIEYESESDLKKAYKQGDGAKVDGRRVLVDVERARTVPNWLPRRLGGGKGPPRFAEPKKGPKSRGSTAPVAPPPSNPSQPEYRGRESYGGPPRSSYGSSTGGGYSGRDSHRGRDYGNRHTGTNPSGSSRYGGHRDYGRNNSNVNGFDRRRSRSPRDRRGYGGHGR